MQSTDFYPKAAMELAMKGTGSCFVGHGEEDHVVAGSRDYRHQSPAPLIDGATTAMSLGLFFEQNISIHPAFQG